MARRITLSVARLGWAAAGDLQAVLYTLIGLAITAAPLLAWRLLAQHLYRDVVLYLPPALVLLSLLLAWTLSGFILCRLSRFLLRWQA